MKQCNKCLKQLPANNNYFSVRRLSADGFTNICKLCSSEYGKMHRKKKRNHKVYKLQ